MPDIRVFHTHIEVFPYHEGDAPNLEKSLSKYDKSRHMYVSVAYHIENDTLYLPRGMSIGVLSRLFSSIPGVVHEPDQYSMIEPVEITKPIRDKIEEDAIDFLLSRNRFIKGKSYSQFGLNLDTGDGKTYCMVHSICKLKLKAMIIVDKVKIGEQWEKTFREISTINPDRICMMNDDISMDKVIANESDYDIYIVTHQRLQSYVRSSSWKEIRELFKTLKIGVKVYDEAHRFFTNILKLDFFSNVKYTYYLTATFSRSDSKEMRIYKSAFSSLTRFGEETYNYEEKRKHINAYILYYNSGCTSDDRIKYKFINKRTGYFSSYAFIKYALNEPSHMLMNITKKIILETDYLEGKSLILSPSIESLEKIKKELSTITTKSIGTIHSKNKDEDNKENYKCDILASTIGGFGTGVDIKGLRKMIVLEPIGSQGRMDQVKGRLRVYSENEDTFLFYPVDVSIPECTDFLKRTLPVLNKKCKSVNHIRYNEKEGILN